MVPTAYDLISLTALSSMIAPNIALRLDRTEDGRSCIHHFSELARNVPRRPGCTIRCDVIPTCGYPLPKSFTTSIGCRPDRASRSAHLRKAAPMFWRQRVRGEFRSAVARRDFARLRREMSYELLSAERQPLSRLVPELRRWCAGEITPAYSLLSDFEVKRAAALLPDARVIIMLRNPIGRAWSQVQLETGRP